MLLEAETHIPLYLVSLSLSRLFLVKEGKRLQGTRWQGRRGEVQRLRKILSVVFICSGTAAFDTIDASKVNQTRPYLGTLVCVCLDEGGRSFPSGKS